MTSSQDKSRYKNFLLIDDDRTFSMVIEAQAKAMNISMSSVKSLTTLQHIKDLDYFDGILLDYDLEDVTGFQVAEALNKLAAHIPIVLVSSTNRPYQDKLAALPNVSGFVSKWANPYQFIQNVCTVMELKPGIELQKSV